MEKAWGYWQAASQLNSDADKAKKAEKIAKGNQKMKLFWSAHERLCKFSDSFKHLMQYLLNPNPLLRYDIAECFDHPWLKGKTLTAKQLKRTMTKHSTKVNQGRTKKIAEQLESENMKRKTQTPSTTTATTTVTTTTTTVTTGTATNGTPTTGHGKAATKPLIIIDISRVNVGVNQRVDFQDTIASERKTSSDNDDNIRVNGVSYSIKQIEQQLNRKDKLAMIQNVAVFNKSRFRLLSDKSLNKICNAINSVANGCKIEFDKNLVEFLITVAIDQGDKDTNSKKFAQIKIKIINQSDIASDEDDDDKDEDYDDDDDDDDDNKDDKKNDSVDEKAEVGISREKYYLIFWRIDTNVEQNQRIMSKLFFDSRIFDLLDPTAAGDKKPKAWKVKHSCCTVVF